MASASLQSAQTSTLSEPPPADKNEDAPAAPLVTIGVRIQGLLDELGHNAAWLSDKVGVSRSTITRILRGERNPTPETLQEIAPILGRSLAQLVANTDAAERVKEAQELVARKDYEAAVRQVIEFERRAHDLQGHLRDANEELRLERDRRRRLSEELEQCRQERDGAKRQALHNEQDARRYREALEKAVADVALLQAQVQELGAAVEAGRRTGRVGAILAGVAAAVSVASYLGSDASGANKPKATRDERAAGARPSAQGKRTSQAAAEGGVRRRRRKKR